MKCTKLCFLYWTTWVKNFDQSPRSKVKVNQKVKNTRSSISWLLFDLETSNWNYFVPLTQPGLVDMSMTTTPWRNDVNMTFQMTSFVNFWKFSLVCLAFIKASKKNPILNITDIKSIYKTSLAPLLRHSQILHVYINILHFDNEVRLS